MVNGKLWTLQLVQAKKIALIVILPQGVVMLVFGANMLNLVDDIHKY